MCLARVIVNNDESKPFASQVTNYLKDGDDLRFMTIFGDDLTLKGDVASIDFTESVIRVVTK